MPATYTPEENQRMQDRIIEEIEKGRSLRKILAEDDDLEFPSRAYIYQWINPEQEKHDPVFADRYARACEIREDKIFEEMLEIADNSENDTVYNDQGKEIINQEWVQRSKLRVDTRKWVLGKMRPKKYGDRVTNVLEGGDKPIDVVDYSKLSPEFLEELAKQANAGTAKS